MNNPLALGRYSTAESPRRPGDGGLSGRGLVEEIVDLAGGLVVDARHLRQVGKRGALDGFQRAEMMQQRALPRRADAGNFLQARLANILLPSRAMRPDGEAVRL